MGLITVFTLQGGESELRQFSAQGPAHDACSEAVMCKVQMGIHPLSISSRVGYTPEVGEWRRQKKLHRRCTEHLLRLDQRNRTSVCVGIYIKGFFFFFFSRSLFCDSRGWRGRCETHRAGCRAGILWRSWSCRTQREFPPLPGNLGSPLQAFQWTESDSAQMMGDNPLCLKSTGYEHHLQDIFTAIAGLGTSGTLAPGSLD